MQRLIRRFSFWFVAVPTLIMLISFAVANRQSVQLYIFPYFVADQTQIDLPLFFLLFVFFGAGAILGSLLTWFRQGVWRKAARKHAAEVEELKRQFSASAVPAPQILPPQL